MLTPEDVESFLTRMGLDFEQIGAGMWSVPIGSGGARLVIHHSPPVLVCRLKMLDLIAADPDQCGDLYRRLLELNATDLMHGAYGIEADSVVLTDALQLENLDFNEFQASIDELGLAVASHVEALSTFSRGLES